MTEYGSIYESICSILDPILAIEGSTDIAINTAPARGTKGAYGTHAFLKIGAGWQMAILPAVFLEDLELVAQVIANRSNIDFRHEAKPIVDGVLPNGMRINVIGAPHVRYEKEDVAGIAFTIRPDATSRRPSVPPAALIPIEPYREPAAAPASFPAWYDQALAALDNGKAVLLAGAKGSGKTWCANLVLSGVRLDRRLITLEDSREIVTPHRNRLSLWFPRTSSVNRVTEADLLNAMRRAGNGMMVFGEFTPTLAPFAREVIQTGTDGGFLATFHANSPAGCWRYLEEHFKDRGFIRENVPFVVFCAERSDGSRTSDLVTIDECERQARAADAPAQ